MFVAFRNQKVVGKFSQQSEVEEFYRNNKDIVVYFYPEGLEVDDQLYR